MIYFRFKIDQNYVGEPPAVEVTITNLNDNIDKQFLKDLIQKCGQFDELHIYYHPTTNKHLGLARVVFESVKCSKACITKFNGMSVMGKVLGVFHDAFGEECKRILDNFTSEQKPKEPAPIATTTLQSTGRKSPLPAAPPFTNDTPTKSDFHPDADYSRGSDSLDAVVHYSSGRDRDYERYSSSHSRDRYEHEDRDDDRHRHKKDHKWEKEKRHHHYHHKTDKEHHGGSSHHHRDRRDRDRDRDRHRDRERDRYREADRDKKDRDYDRDRRRDRDVSRDKYRVRNYQKSCRDRDYNSVSSTAEYTSQTDTNFGSSYKNIPPVIQPPAPYNSYPISSGSYVSQPPLPHDSATTSASSYYPPPPPMQPQAMWHQMSWQTVQPPPPVDPWTSRPAAPPPEPSESSSSSRLNSKSDRNKDNETKKATPPTADDEDQATIDLDTRIALMFKEKSFGAAPPFIQLEDSDTEVDHHHKGDSIASDTIKNQQLTTSIPSPSGRDVSRKKSKKKYRKEQKRLREAGASDISSSDDDILLQKGSYTSPSVRKDEDRMSLSSLSSTEDRNSQPPLPPLPPPQMVQSGSYLYPAGIHPYYYPQAGPSDYNPYSQQNPYMQQNYSYMQSFVPGFSHLIPNYVPPPPSGGSAANSLANDYNSSSGGHLNSRRSESRSTASIYPKRDPCERIITTVLDRVTNELKQILKKDFNKKMIENTAYKRFETWWSDQERTKGKNADLIDGTPLSGGLKPMDKAPDINQLLNNNRDALDTVGTGGIMSLGLRAQIPKLPSFRRIRKQPSPVRPRDDDEDLWNDLSDQEDMVQGGSDSEHEDAHQTAKTSFSQSSTSIASSAPVAVTKSVERPMSTSTVSSESENDDSSSDSDSESDSSSSDTRQNVTPTAKAGPSKSITPSHHKENSKPIYSDSDSEIGVKTSAPVTSPTIKPAKASKKLTADGIYSDSSSDEDTATKKSELLPPPLPAVAAIEKPMTPPPKTPEPVVVEEMASQSPKPPRTPGRESPEEPKKKSRYDYDRIYSDSDEEREYQEKRRRNTEYMEQIEREFLEEQQRVKEEMEEKRRTQLISTTTEDEDEVWPEKAPSPADPVTPSLSQPPPTPGAQIFSAPYFSPATQPVKAITHATVSTTAPAKSPAATKRRTTGQKQKQTTPIAITAVQHPLPAATPTVVIHEVTTTTLTIDKAQPMEINGISSSIAIADPLTIPFVDPNRMLKMSPASSDGGSSQESQASQIALDHCYCLPPHASPPSASTSTASASAAQINSDIGPPPLVSRVGTGNKIDPISATSVVTAPAATEYTTTTGRPESVAAMPLAVSPQKSGPGRPKKETAAARSKKDEKLAAANVVATMKRDAPPLSLFMPEQRFMSRDARSEMMLLYGFLTKGIDAEDIQYLKESYEYLLQDDANNYWLNATHWVDHCVTDRSLLPPPSKKRKRDDENKLHASGSARTEGFYKVDLREKAKFKYHHAKLMPGETAATAEAAAAQSAKLGSKMQGASREARSNQRRLLTAFGASTESELLKFNQLKFRKKQLKFAKSAIHDWGLFAMEPIAADEMVIEYVGQMIRPVVADLRETKYEAIGIGSSYLFRIDLETIIDATKCGNLARFINHSCNVSIDPDAIITVAVVVVVLKYVICFSLFTAQLLCESNNH